MHCAVLLVLRARSLEEERAVTEQLVAGAVRRPALAGFRVLPQEVADRSRVCRKRVVGPHAFRAAAVLAVRGQLNSRAL